MEKILGIYNSLKTIAVKYKFSDGEIMYYYRNKFKRMDRLNISEIYKRNKLKRVEFYFE